MESLPTLRQMQYLLALADHRNFQKAAESCHVTQSTLSGGIKDMEDILRSPVIDRTGRRAVRFTPLGEEWLAEARATIARLETLAARSKTNNKQLSWPLKMGVIPTIAPYLLPRVLKPLQKKLPDLELHIHELRSQNIVEKLHDGTIDFALMAFPFDVKGLHKKIVMEEKFFLAAPRGFQKGKSPVALKDVADKKLLLLEDGHCLRDHALDACKWPVAQSKALNAASLATLIQLVHQGYGVTLLPAMAAADPSLPKGLEIRPLAGAASRDIGFAWKKGGPREKDIALVTNALEGLIKDSSRAKSGFC